MTTATFTAAVQVQLPHLPRLPRLFDAAAAMATLRRWWARQQRPVQAVQADQQVDQRARARLQAAQQSTACWRSSFCA